MWLISLLLLLPFIGSVIAALLPTNARNAASSWAGGITLVVLVMVSLLFDEVRDGGIVRESIAWLPVVGLEFVIRVDGFAWMFAMLIAGIGLLVIVYARY